MKNIEQSEIVRVIKFTESLKTQFPAAAPDFETMIWALGMQLKTPPVNLDNNDDAIWHCPNCKFGFAESTDGKDFCPKCGQHINWEIQ